MPNHYLWLVKEEGRWKDIHRVIEQGEGGMEIGRIYIEQGYQYLTRGHAYLY